MNTPQGPEPRWAEDNANLRELLRAAETTLLLQGELTHEMVGHCSIEFVAQDAFHRSYVVSTGQDDYVIRLTLPIVPNLKTESEVAMLEWVARHTGLTVPHIYDHESNPSNYLGIEFILMSKPRGKPLAALWRDLDFPAKEEIVRRIAAFASETFQKKTHRVGSLFIGRSQFLETAMGPQQRPRRGIDYLYMGPCVSPAFISPSSRAVYSGPFTSAQRWIVVRIDFALADRRRRLEVAQASGNNSGGGGGSEDDVEDPERLENAIVILQRLRPLVDSLFPDESVDPDPSMFFHSDLSKQNILVSETMPVTVSVANWGFTSAVPLSVGCQYPAFLKGRPSHDQPIRAEYLDAENGEPSELYWERLDMYELTQLRGLFLEEMKRMQPGWVQVFGANQRQRDFDLAISSADDLSMGGRLRSWLTDMESGQTDFLGLEERIG